MENKENNKFINDAIREQNLAAAIVAFIAETKDVHADSTNPFHKNKYASLGAHLSVVKPIAAKHGLAIFQIPCTEENCIGIRTTIFHKDGGSISEFVGIPANTETSGQDAGSIISYLRRYSLAAAAGIATEDDDAEADRSVRASNYVPNPNASRATQSAPAPATNSQSSAVSDDPVIPFGKNKGQNLSSLGDNDLDYWANKWEPKPWEKTGKVGPKDLALKAAAVKLWNSRNTSNATSDDVPF